MKRLSEEELARYKRNIKLEEIGESGQMKLRDAKVLVVGTGGLGSPVAYYLASCGVGTIGLIDGDVVDSSNLQRQILHRTCDIGRKKVDSAAEKLIELNPNITVEKHDCWLTADNVGDTIAPCDFVVDATDSGMTKLLINDACVAAGKPFSYGGVYRYSGITFTHLPGTAHYRTFFPVSEGALPSRSQNGILGVVPGILGSIQATEAIKYITGIGTLLTDRMLRFNALDMTFDIFKI